MSILLQKYHGCFLGKLFLAIVFGLISIHTYAQEEETIRPIIEAGDLKKLMKADAYRSDADKLIEEVNRLNMEVLTIQGDASFDEKEIKKKTEPLQTQALQKHVQASALYEKCNELKFIIYKKYLDNFWKMHSGEESSFLNAKLLEEQASDSYFQATSYRIDAKRMNDSDAKIEKLTEADELELDAIRKQLSSLGECYGITVVPTETVAEAQSEPEPLLPVQQQPVPEQPVQQALMAIPDTAAVAESTIPGKVEVNQQMLVSYNRYIATGQYNDTTLSTGKIAGITSFERDEVLALWYDYMYGKESRAGIALLLPESTSADSTVTAGQVTVLPAGAEAEVELGVVTDENRGTLVPTDEEVIYRVQISANRTELTQRALSRIYYGNKNVEMVNENGWFKYSVGDFYTYEEASKFRKQSGIDNAFVVAYRKGALLKPLAEPAGEKTSQVSQVQSIRMPSGLVFRIQVAATRVPLNKDQLAGIYNGRYPVEVVTEEGWYKYQFMGVRLYSDATTLIRDVASRGAFIVAYEDGVKQNMASAVNKIRELEQAVKTSGRAQLREVEFHVQLAASRNFMKPAELAGIYKGSETVVVIHEDGWYKYHLKAGNSLDVANELKKNCGINGAFIVPYRRAAKIGLYEAMQDLK